VMVKTSLQHELA